MSLAGLPPAVVNAPPTYRSPPDSANANTVLFMPEPSADQLLPFHLAMLVAALPPADAKKPPTYRSLPDTASAVTVGGVTPTPPTPKPSAAQLLPFHLAMELAATSP